MWLHYFCSTSYIALAHLDQKFPEPGVVVLAICGCIIFVRHRISRSLTLTKNFQNREGMFDGDRGGTCEGHQQRQGSGFRRTRCVRWAARQSWSGRRAVFEEPYSKEQKSWVGLGRSAVVAAGGVAAPKGSRQVRVVSRWGVGAGVSPAAHGPRWARKVNEVSRKA
jgi:hypothetical protein